uniref:SCAN box domain-containing protein n=1 Tax=Sphenodon punctatus TaxID=8508 RepID=A0A8D0H3P2_SPHPU
MGTKVQEEQSLDVSCPDPREEQGPSGNLDEHQTLDTGETKADSECAAAAGEAKDLGKLQTVNQSQAASVEEEPKTQVSVLPSAAEVAREPLLGEGKGAKRMMEEDEPNLAPFEQVSDSSQESRESGGAVFLPHLVREAQQAHGSLDASGSGVRTSMEVSGPCHSHMGTETYRKRFRGFRYQESEGPQGAFQRLQQLSQQWLKPEIRTKEEIVEQLVLEQFLSLLPEASQRWVRERRPENTEEAVALAEDYQFLHPDPGRRQHQERTRQRDSARSWLR